MNVGAVAHSGEGGITPPPQLCVRASDNQRNIRFRASELIVSTGIICDSLFRLVYSDVSTYRNSSMIISYCFRHFLYGLIWEVKNYITYTSVSIASFHNIHSINVK
jgi:hypothetical protein